MSEEREQPMASIMIRVEFDTDDLDNAYLAAQGVVKELEAMEAVEAVDILAGVADDDGHFRKVT
jgi:hypothetical protein